MLLVTQGRWLIVEIDIWTMSVTCFIYSLVILVLAYVPQAFVVPLTIRIAHTVPDDTFERDFKFAKLHNFWGYVPDLAMPTGLVRDRLNDILERYGFATEFEAVAAQSARGEETCKGRGDFLDFLDIDEGREAGLLQARLEAISAAKNAIRDIPATDSGMLGGSAWVYLAFAAGGGGLLTLLLRAEVVGRTRQFMLTPVPIWLGLRLFSGEAGDGVPIIRSIGSLLRYVIGFRRLSIICLVSVGIIMSALFIFGGVLGYPLETSRTSNLVFSVRSAVAVFCLALPIVAVLFSFRWDDVSDYFRATHTGGIVRVQLLVGSVLFASFFCPRRCFGGRVW